MKTILTTILLLAATWVQAGLVIDQTGLLVNIPDGNPVGVQINGTVSGPADNVISLTVGLNISGGYNGDLYSYLVSPNGTVVVLLNQPGVGINGFGASGAGMNITLQDTGANNASIQDVTSGAYLTGSYNAAGSLSYFNGGAANGTWTLFFADLSSGGGTSQLNGWSLDITAVPEPVNIAMAIFGVVLVAVGFGRSWVRDCKLISI